MDRKEKNTFRDYNKPLHDRLSKKEILEGLFGFIGDKQVKAQIKEVDEKGLWGADLVDCNLLIAEYIEQQIAKARADVAREIKCETTNEGKHIDDAISTRQMLINVRAKCQEILSEV